MKGSQNQMEMKSDLQIEREIVKKGEARKMMQLKKKFILKEEVLEKTKQFHNK
jgi:hypothetical protein